MDLLEMVVYMIIGFSVENSCFELTHHYYCWKNKGKCENCKDWSCPRQKYTNNKKS